MTIDTSRYVGIRWEHDGEMQYDIKTLEQVRELDIPELIVHGSVITTEELAYIWPHSDRPMWLEKCNVSGNEEIRVSSLTATDCRFDRCTIICEDVVTIDDCTLLGATSITADEFRCINTHITSDIRMKCFRVVMKTCDAQGSSSGVFWLKGDTNVLDIDTKTYQSLRIRYAITDIRSYRVNHAPNVYRIVQYEANNMRFVWFDRKRPTLYTHGVELPYDMLVRWMKHPDAVDMRTFLKSCFRNPQTCGFLEAEGIPGALRMLDMVNQLNDANPTPYESTFYQ